MLGGRVNKLIAVMLLVLGTSTVLMATPPPPTIPEIDATTSMAAVALIAGAMLVIRGRRNKK
jgi:hypothetical protein